MYMYVHTHIQYMMLCAVIMLVTLHTCIFSASLVLPIMHRSEWEEAVAKRQDEEQSYLTLREQRIEENEAQLQHLRQRNMEEFNKIKIKLETDIQVLQQQIEQMKATFLLNAEKLEYNFQVREEMWGDVWEGGRERREDEKGGRERGRKEEEVERKGGERGMSGVTQYLFHSLVLGAKFSVCIPNDAVAV